MTGYGKAVVTHGDKKINIEVKSLNSKALDLSTRICPLYREKEIEIRQTIAQRLERGKQYGQRRMPHPKPRPSTRS